MVAKEESLLKRRGFKVVTLIVIFWRENSGYRKTTFCVFDIKGYR